jgi:hypothetical protein
MKAWLEILTDTGVVVNSVTMTEQSDIDETFAAKDALAETVGSRPNEAGYLSLDTDDGYMIVPLRRIVAVLFHRVDD